MKDDDKGLILLFGDIPLKEQTRARKISVQRWQNAEMRKQQLHSRVVEIMCGKAAAQTYQTPWTLGSDNSHTEAIQVLVWQMMLSKSNPNPGPGRAAAFYPDSLGSLQPFWSAMKWNLNTKVFTFVGKSLT
ncbi:hypothetical protein AV530_007444 [Patagioenas fasciata monilis]|uniref:Uncharacterized protein n=1 Tax=Patagioenas fasciata monilis TaxID=372326 RepID=A0A1V4JXZ9_PATFA|nr:hypothetical protein AV530_007444 [Patagioenas fasciata monilis]